MKKGVGSKNRWIKNELDKRGIERKAEVEQKRWRDNETGGKGGGRIVKSAGGGLKKEAEGGGLKKGGGIKKMKPYGEFREWGKRKKQKE